MKKIKRVIILFLVNNIFCGTRFWKIKRFLLRNAGIEIGKNSKVVGPLNIGTVAKLKIGNECWIGANLNIYGNGKVIVNDKCDFAPNVSFITGSHNVGNQERRAGNGISYIIEVKNGCWIGANSTLMKNIVVNEGVIIGACSLVNKDIKSNIIIGGNPAKIISELD